MVCEINAKLDEHALMVTPLIYYPLAQILSAAELATWGVGPI